ncbi:MAG: ADP-ribosylglycohydrolase family protein, partial [Actinomycetota bacterium]|nr:ADP-ribosylglycohydrolase family protein [Actinomycetota bacterium]
MHDVLDVRDILSDELAQRRESGYDVEGLEGRINGALAGYPEEELWRLLELLEDAPRRPRWPYDEPSGLEKIRESLPKTPQLPASSLGGEGLRDRLRAAWLGRCAGCNLGKPVEGWTREDIRRYLELAGEYPIQDYVPRLEPMPEGFEMHPSWGDAVRGNVRFMARDDDIDYTILGLHILETYDLGFGPENVAEEWMSHMPFLATYTA